MLTLVLALLPRAAGSPSLEVPTEGPRAAWAVGHAAPGRAGVGGLWDPFPLNRAVLL